nr:hypothetical protein [Candidatus Sigynarchaeota archaeon]
MAISMTEYCELCGKYMYGDGKRVDTGPGGIAWACTRCQKNYRQESNMSKIKYLAKNVIHVLRAPGYYWKGHEKKIRIDRDVPLFSALAKEIIDEKRTLLGHDRLYTIWQCIVNAPAGSNALEIGVYRGGSAKFIAGAMFLR